MARWRPVRQPCVAGSHYRRTRLGGRSRRGGTTERYANSGWATKTLVHASVADSVANDVPAKTAQAEDVQDIRNGPLPCRLPAQLG